VWHTAKAAIPILKEQGTGGSIILTSSATGLKANPNLGHYVAARHGAVGLMRTTILAESAARCPEQPCRWRRVDGAGRPAR
jgi:NAD(P)-dependent dehydrogenase (short-subunit alcohol dehydrogenase family)